MRIVVNNIIPFGSFVAMNVGPWIFVKDVEKVTPTLLNHESIHWEQQKELLIVGFYLLYILFFLAELVRCALDRSRGTRADGRHRSLWKRTYHSVAIEREAYAHQGDGQYIKNRKKYAWA